jgi:hypothetical protein
MKGGHGDTFYYQLAANVRRFKGVRPIPDAQPQAIRVDGSFEDWAAVAPEYRDDAGDPVHRRHRGWGKGSEYVNETGRNDIIAAKVSWDETNVYFYARAAAKLTASTDSNWMMLFLNTDGNATNGWLGYDYVINRAPTPGNNLAVIEKQGGPEYAWSAPAIIPIRIGETELELSIPRSALRLESSRPAIDFKWADNIQQTGDWSDFTLNGDCAPNSRLNYRVILRPAK